MGAGAPVPTSPLCLHAQVYRAKLEGDSAALPPRMKSSTPSSSQLNISALGRSPSPKVGLQGGAVPFGGLLPSSSPAPGSQGCAHPLVLPQGPPHAQSHAGSLPRNLAATLQDIETKRQLALQQKGKLLGGAPPVPNTQGRALAGLQPLCASWQRKEPGSVPFLPGRGQRGLPGAAGALWMAQPGAAVRLQWDTGASLTVSCFSPSLSPLSLNPST